MSAHQETIEIRGLARDFAAAELRPHTERWDAERAVDPDVIGRIAELGFLGMLVPEALGGMGFELPTYVAALEELAWGEPAIALLVAESVIATDLLARLSGTAQRELLAELASGAKLGCIAFAEDDGGVSATRSGNDWKLNGSRSWVTNAAGADIAIVAARDGADTALFVVPAGSYTVDGAAATMGLRAVPVNSIRLDDVTVARDSRLEWTGESAQDALAPIGVLSAAAIGLAIAQAALDHAVAYAAQREQFGRPLRSFEGIQFKLAEMATRVTAARALLDRAAAEPDDPAAAAMAKLTAGTCAMFVTTEAVQIFGGYGYMRDYPVEKLMRDAKAMEILHGTNEMQRLKIAASLYAE